MATKSITIHIEDEQGEDQPVEVLLKSAKPIDGFFRSELMMKAVAMDGESQLRKQAAFFVYPTCVACVKSPQWIHDLPFEDFVSKIDEADMDTWAAAAYELNPQWVTRNKAITEFTAQEEKKIGVSASGSVKPTEA